MPSPARTDYRLTLLEIDAEVCRTMDQAAPLIDAGLTGLLDSFYGHLANFSEVEAILAGHSLERLKEAQKAHWQNLFSGRFDDAYRQRAYAVGRAHERIGLKPTWYIGGYAFILTRLIDDVLSRHRRVPDTAAATLKALVKAVMLDIDIAVSAYITATSEIARNVTTAATGTRDASRHIAKLAEEVQASRDFAAALNASAKETTASITELEQRVGGLIASLRSDGTRERSAGATGAGQWSAPARHNGTPAAVTHRPKSFRSFLANAIPGSGAKERLPTTGR